MEQTALTTLETFRLPALGGQAANYDPEEFADIALDFPQVKIPAGGQLSFELPNPLDPDDPTPCKTIEGVIVLQQTANAYWQDSDTTGAPPDCSSDDGVTGYGTPGGLCAACPLNTFGSGEGGKGKACKNMKNLYILQDGSPMPLLLPLPPTSLKAFRQYANNLRFAGLGLSGVDLHRPQAPGERRQYLFRGNLPHGGAAWGSPDGNRPGLRPQHAGKPGGNAAGAGPADGLRGGGAGHGPGDRRAVRRRTHALLTPDRSRV